MKDVGFFFNEKKWKKKQKEYPDVSDDPWQAMTPKPEAK